MELTLRSAQVLKQQAEDIGFQGKDILEYVKEQQKLDREERAAWRNIRIAELQAEEKKRAYELQAEEKKRADEIRLAQIEIEKELKIKEMENYKLNKLKYKLPPVLQPLHPLVMEWNPQVHAKKALPRQAEAVAQTDQPCSVRLQRSSLGIDRI